MLMIINSHFFFLDILMFIGWYLINDGYILKILNCAWGSYGALHIIFVLL